MVFQRKLNNFKIWNSIIASKISNMFFANSYDIKVSTKGKKKAILSRYNLKFKYSF
ncbi:unknown; predicted coding region [Mycoplasmopsis pulmonis]|uniref:Uncharacterized protein n=1 Tax=Mycoplasmopsis pulmonis (strain UAB CTIP) TaxID=272635 RepID=Q98QF7_MYCPU|nr:unknown; predicted coding region [Mycoplasmopsis pulmonis]